MENSIIKDFSISSIEIDEIIDLSSHSEPIKFIKLLQSKGGLKYFEKGINSNIQKGIDGSEKDRALRIRHFGDNYDMTLSPKSFCQFVCEVLSDTFLRVLILCAIFQISIGASPLSENPDKDWIDGLGIVFAIILIVLTSSITNYKKENEFRKLSEINNKNNIVTVLRNNNQITMNYNELLVGDIVNLYQGMIIPADGIVIQSDDLKIDESAITGESKIIKKNNLENCIKVIEKKISNENINKSNKDYSLTKNNNLLRDNNNKNQHKDTKNSTSYINNSISIPIVYSSTLVNSGFGVFMVLAVGKKSAKGKLQQMVLNEGNNEESKTPLELKLEDVAEDIGKFGMYAAVFTFIALISKYLFSKYSEYEYHSKILQEHIFNLTSLYNVNKDPNLKYYLDSISNSSNLIYSHDNIFLGNLTNNFINRNISNSVSYFNYSSFNLTNSDHLINPKNIFEGAYKEIFSIIILCITIIVVAIPEGLPLAVTLALSFSVNKMMKVNNLVRNMSACEVVGGANYICTDKTGTLTKNKLELNGFILHDQVYEKRNNDSHKNIPLIKSYIGETYFSIIVDSILLNSNIVLNNDFEVSHGLELDKSSFEFFNENFKEETIKIMKNSKNIIHDRINFSSLRKKMTTIIKLEKGKYRIYSKGAAEYILDVSSHFINYKKKSFEALSDSYKNLINLNIEKFASMSYRIIGIAYKDVSENEIKDFRETNPDENTDNYPFEKNGFQFLGLLCFKDCFRPGVPEAVIKCRKAGINVIMITGDNPISALAIAQDCNILTSSDLAKNNEIIFNSNDKDKKIDSLNNELLGKGINNCKFLDPIIDNFCNTNYISQRNNHCITGVEFFNRIGGLLCDTCSSQIENCQCPINEKEAERAGLPIGSVRRDRIGSLISFQNIINQFKVFARTRPIDKYCLVKGLKELNHVVAVTGDGTNDAMALSKSDVGFSMGIAGTDIAKNASDIILLDDNFASIVNAVKWGRGIFDNIRKYIQFQLSVNISAVLLVFFSSCVGSESPITPIQMLWLNMIMDSLGSLCLATEDPSESVLNRKPYSKREYIINSLMWKHILFQALFQFTIVFILYIYAPKFIRENDSEKIFLNNQLENCFGKIQPLKITFQNHQLNHYILDGKKSMWDPLKQIKRNLDKDFCFFYNLEKFEKGKIKNLKNAYKWIISEYGSTTHMTLIFNTFVLYALFNQINSRILDDSLNIFKNLHKNFLFVLIITLEIIVQYLIIQYGGLIFNCVKGGLTKDQWIMCVFIAFISFLISSLLKFTKFEKFFEIYYIRKLKNLFCKNVQNVEEDKLVEMVENNNEEYIG